MPRSFECGQVFSLERSSIQPVWNYARCCKLGWAYNGMVVLFWRLGQITSATKMRLEHLSANLGHVLATRCLGPAACMCGQFNQKVGSDEQLDRANWKPQPTGKRRGKCNCANQQYKCSHHRRMGLKSQILDLDGSKPVELSCRSVPGHAGPLYVLCLPSFGYSAPGQNHSFVESRRLLQKAKLPAMLSGRKPTEICHNRNLSIQYRKRLSCGKH